MRLDSVLLSNPTGPRTRTRAAACDPRTRAATCGPRTRDATCDPCTQGPRTRRQVAAFQSLTDPKDDELSNSGLYSDPLLIICPL